MAGYLGASPVPQTIQKKQSFTATASQTTFTTTGYTDGAFINVYLNGVRLINGTDYQATNGSDIVLTTGASASDVLDFETFNEFTLIDQTLETPTFRTSATLKNDTHEDTDGGRESTLIFKGEQSGGEISTLAEIEASHDGTADDQKGDLIFKTNDGSDNDAPTEAARIDSAQNLLVGKTDTGVTTSGTIVQSNGSTWKIRDGNAPLFLKRLSSDGDIVEFYKDGTSVGSIQARSSFTTLQIGSTGTGITGTSSHRILPSVNNARSDNTNDLGDSSYRWKDLYLSGGAYLGGTVAANHLDDYEEGTWTPTYTSSGTDPTFTPNLQNGIYTKIGRLVYASFRIRGAITGTKTGNLRISGLPFTSNSSPANGSGGIGLTEKIGADNYPTNFRVNQSATYVNLQTYDTSDPRDGLFSSVTVSSTSTASDGNYLIGHVVYQT